MAKRDEKVADPPRDPDEERLRAWYNDVRVLDLSKFSPAPVADPRKR